MSYPLVRMGRKSTQKNGCLVPPPRIEAEPPAWGWRRIGATDVVSPRTASHGADHGNRRGAPCASALPNTAYARRADRREWPDNSCDIDYFRDQLNSPIEFDAVRKWLLLHRAHVSLAISPVEPGRDARAVLVRTDDAAVSRDAVQNRTCGTRSRSSARCFRTR